MRVFRTDLFSVQENGDRSIEFHIDSSVMGYLMHALLQSRPQGTTEIKTPKGVLRVHVHGKESSTPPPPPHTPIESK